MMHTITESARCALRQAPQHVLYDHLSPVERDGSNTYLRHDRITIAREGAGLRVGFHWRGKALSFMSLDHAQLAKGATLSLDKIEGRCTVREVGDDYRCAAELRERRRSWLDRINSYGPFASTVGLGLYVLYVGTGHQPPVAQSVLAGLIVAMLLPRLWPKGQA